MSKSGSGRSDGVVSSFDQSSERVRAVLVDIARRRAEVHPGPVLLGQCVLVFWARRAAAAPAPGPAAHFHRLYDGTDSPSDRIKPLGTANAIPRAEVGP